MIVGVSIGSYGCFDFNQGLLKSMHYLRQNQIDAFEIKMQTCDDPQKICLDYFQNFFNNHPNAFACIGLHLPNYIFDSTTSDRQNGEKILSQIVQIIEKFECFNIDYFVLHCNSSTQSYQNTYHSKFYNIISSITDFFERNKLLLTLENAHSLIDLKKMADLVREIDSKSLKITLDLGHAHIRNNFDTSMSSLYSIPFRLIDCCQPISNIRYFMPYEKYGTLDNFFVEESDLIYNIHIHDYNGITDHLSLAAGKIDFSFLQSMKTNYHGIYTLEMKYNDLETINMNYQTLLRMINGN